MPAACPLPTRPRIVVALGGNALMAPDEPLSIANQRRNAGQAAASIAEICEDRDIIVTHGNGPQVGALALQSQAAAILSDQSLDVLNAESEGMIGYVLEQELCNRIPDRKFTSLLTMVVVDPRSTDTAAPRKPIGPWYGPEEWQRLRDRFDWVGVEENGRHRRVVPSPQPLEVLEIAAIEALVAADIIPICAGGGGIAVERLPDGTLRGIEAVVDKDLTSALLALTLGASHLLLLTDVDAVYKGWGGQEPQALSNLDRAGAADLDLPAGSMGPKVEAAVRFAESGGTAVIGRLQDAAAMLAGDAGTIINAESG
jgi:carbamate kinase